MSLLHLLCWTGDPEPPEARCEPLLSVADHHLNTHTQKYETRLIVILGWGIMCVCDVCVLLTLESVWDELNREHNGPTTANGVRIQMNLRCGVKRRAGKKEKDKSKGKDKRKAWRREAEVWKQGKIKVT